MTSFVLLAVLALLQGALFLVKWFVVGFLVTAGFALANRWFKAVPRGPQGEQGDRGFPGPPGLMGERGRDGGQA